MGLGNLLSYRQLLKETPTANIIPYSHHITDTIISTKNAEYLSVWQLGGRSHQSAAESELFQWVDELNNLLRGMATANIALWTHIVRRKTAAYPDSHFSNKFCQQLNEQYKQSFAEDNLMVNDLYLTIIIKSSSDNILNFFARHESQNLEQKYRQQQASIKELTDINRLIASSFSKYNATLLGIYDKNGYSYSSALEFLAYLVNGQHKPVPICRNRFANYMVDSRLLFSKWGELAEIRNIDKQRLFGMLEITDYSTKTEPGQFNSLLESDYEFILTQSFTALSKQAAKGFLQKHKQQLIDTQDVAYQQVDEIDEALNGLISGQFVMGEHHATLLIFGNEHEQLRKDLAKASSQFIDTGVIAKVCDLALEAAFWAQLPTCWAYRPRPAPITSLNFLSFSPFHNFMIGKATGNPWDPAVTMFKTISQTPLYFNFHASPLAEDSYDKRLLGNTMFIGKSGTGKTVLLGFLMAQAQKYAPTIVAFDKDRGMEIAIRAMGGCYLPLKKGHPADFNPFQLAPTADNMSFLKEFIQHIAGSSSTEPLTHSDITEIEQALDTLMHNIEQPLRSFSMLIQGLPNPLNNNIDTRPTVHARLTKWCNGGELGWLFDNATDVLNLESHKLYGFDVTEFLDDPVTRVPIIMYLLHRTESMIDGRRFMYVFDEFWKILQDPYFEELAKNKQKTIRKQNGIFIFATQEPSDALDSPIAKTLVQQCATFVFLPNPGADKEDYTNGFKLTEAEFNQLIGLTEDSRCFLIKQSDSSIVAELDLSNFSEELLVLSGTPDNAELAQNIITTTGSDDPEMWLPKFLVQVQSNKATSKDFISECTTVQHPSFVKEAADEH